MLVPERLPRPLKPAFSRRLTGASVMDQNSQVILLHPLCLPCMTEPNLKTHLCFSTCSSSTKHCCPLCAEGKAGARLFPVTDLSEGRRGLKPLELKSLSSPDVCISGPSHSVSPTS